MLARLQIRYREIPIVFADSRKFARAEARPGSSRSVEKLLTSACLALIAALVAEIAASS